MNEEQKPSVLFVDEDNFLLGIYAERMHRKSWHMDYALSAEEAVRKLSDGKYDVVVLDVMVEKLPGVEILKTIKEKHLAKTSSIVILTNNDKSEDIEEARKHGADGYIVKAHNTPAEVVEEIGRIYTKNV